MLTISEKKDDKDDKDKKGGDEEDKAEEVVDGFMSAFCKLEMNKLNDYVDEESEELKNLDVEKILNEELGSLGEEFEGYEEEFKDVVDTIIDMMTDNMDYEIKSTEKDGDNYKVTAEFKCVDFAELGESISDMGDSIGEDFVTELLEEGTINEEMSEEEMMEAMIPELIKLLKETVKDSAKDMEPKTAEVSFVVSEVDGEWVILTEESNMDEIGEIFEA